MIGYDDTNAISRIQDLMRETPAISRRAAIIKVAGEGSLRRIEVKMKALEHRAQPQHDHVFNALLGWLRGSRVLAVPFDSLSTVEGRVMDFTQTGLWIETASKERRRVVGNLTNLVASGGRVRVYTFRGRPIYALNLDEGTYWEDLNSFDQKMMIAVAGLGCSLAFGAWQWSTQSGSGAGLAVVVLSVAVLAYAWGTFGRWRNDERLRSSLKEPTIGDLQIQG